MSNPVWTGELQVAGLSIAVKVITGPRTESIELSKIHTTCGRKIKWEPHCECKPAAIPWPEVGMGYEFEKGKYIEILEKETVVAPTRDIVITHFVKAQDVDPSYFESTYYLAPAGDSEPLYADLLSSLRSLKVFAACKTLMRARDRGAILRPGKQGILLHTLFFQDEMRALNEFRTVFDAGATSSQLLISRFARKNTREFDPAHQYADEHTLRLGAVIADKIRALPQVVAPQKART